MGGGGGGGPSKGEIEVTCVQFKHPAHFELNLCLCVSLHSLSSAFKYGGATLSY